MADIWLSRLVNKTPRTLPILHLMVTDRCNLRCPMCGVRNHDPAEQDTLSAEEWKAVIRSAAKLRTVIISITGGEPLLRHDVFELISYAREHGIAVHLNTNGTLLTDEKVGMLGECGLTTLSISLESTEPTPHNAIRGAKTFEKTIEGIRRVRRQVPSIHLGINVLITMINFRGMADLVPFAESLGAHQIKFAPIHTNLLHRDNPLAKFKELVFKEEDLKDLDSELGKLERALAKSRLHSACKYFLRGIKRLYETPGCHFCCYAGYATCVVNPHGSVAPCFDKESPLNVRNSPLERIWGSDEFARLRQEVRNCRQACWDTTNTEISLRFDIRAVLADVTQVWRDIAFYFGNAKP